MSAMAFAGTMLPKQINEVCDMHNLGSCRDGILIEFHNGGIVFKRLWKLDPNQFYFIALFPLFPGIHHVGVIVFAQYHFIPFF